ncbi:tetraacyldisaccharide 4'-kinase [Algibacter amylolyticus]|uniref:Tetraacyldisaccharide 4'-kinase n=1 Tax=Algibacter amylolyticus TaxID=1608400 RepID=A0A5M7B3I1_9FLAO|nr:tetraacyldisaccharide 4'-kinase [Algibacter amylolyticus]KAA5824136.1 tetraacyldisaccharide 4'-kinase [Algibacter amylolyticus]MBB5269694.1 tetraacyldisaccharide 4'-kinase [Algibacter amylolyticus]TSJ74613.1 tetraacyldisaccharide 4'-kinase [Algibacter amylolyticus]
MNIIRKLLFPVVPIYFMVTWLRNKLYDLGIKKSKSYKLPVICVGNLSAGGTGKTPMIEYLIRLLKDDFKVATLSRGYKRKTEGFQLANTAATADTIGDEPFQFYTKFKDSILVAVDADRKHGIEILQNEKPDVILLDDAYQHRKVSAGFNVLLSTYANPFFKDIVLPTGNLREPRSGSKRADVIIVTKCPKGLNASEKSNIVKRISPETHQHVFFSTIDYAKSVIAADKTEYIENLVPFTLVTGIANAKPLVNYLNEKNLKFEHLNFKDHYNFTLNDIENLAQKEVIVTTEKDYMRLKQYDSLKEKLFYLPIAVNIDDADKLNTLIKAFVKH